MGLRPLVLAALLLSASLPALAQSDPHHPEESPPAIANGEQTATPAPDATVPQGPADCPPSATAPGMGMGMMSGEQMMPMMQMMGMMQSMQNTQQEMMRTMHLMQQQMMLMQRQMMPEGAARTGEMQP